MYNLEISIQVATTDEAQKSSAAVETYVKNLKELERKKEDREKIEEKAKLMEQVATLSAINQSDTMMVTPLLIESMLEEAAKLRRELQDMVSIIMHEKSVMCTLYFAYRTKLYQTLIE